MIHYHGGPITPTEVAVKLWTSRHAMISFANPEQISLAAEVCQSFCIDNGAFSMWKSGIIPDWGKYYEWLTIWSHHPAFDFAIIPDVIEGSEEDNDRLISDWFSPWDRGQRGDYFKGVPVWHLHESLERLHRLMRFPRVAIGSSGEYAVVGTEAWWSRMDEAMQVVCDSEGTTQVKLHGLRMLNPTVFSRLPLSSADSTNIARNIGIDQSWKGTYVPKTKMMRALVLADRIEHHASAARWTKCSLRENLELVG